MVKLGVLHHHVAPLDLIDCNSVLSGVVLLQASQETLGEEETTDPEVGWLAFFDPLLDEAKTLNKVDDVARERLERWVRTLCPQGWDLVVEQGEADLFKLGAHHDLTLDGELDVFERSTDDA